ncbi:hypothetical protein VTK56DRAFT_3000 [Thermocarpiscus australiensis]
MQLLLRSSDSAGTALTPLGYRLSWIAFNPDTGEPLSGPDSNDALTDIPSSRDTADCPDRSFSAPSGWRWTAAPAGCG